MIGPQNTTMPEKRHLNHQVVAHYKEAHQEAEPEASMRVVKVLDRPLERQSFEDFLIQNSNGTEIMNSRG